MAEKRTYRLKIEGSSPETMPMKRLAEYLSDMAVLLGEEPNVHLMGIEGSSTCPIVLIDWQAEAGILARIQKARNREGPEDAIHAMDNFDARLKRDNRSAAFINPANKPVIEFPGATRPQAIEWPSINQPAELCGIPIMVGGRSDPVPVHLLDGETEWLCSADRTKAIGIAQHLFTTTLRVSGRGRWRKIETGEWALERFVIEGYEQIRLALLDETIRELRSIKAKWKELEDPLAEVEAIRTGKRT